MASNYTTTLPFAEFISSQSILKALQREVDCIKKMHVYHDPWNAAYLIKWEIETPDYSFVKEDF